MEAQARFPLEQDETKPFPDTRMPDTRMMDPSSAVRPQPYFGATCAGHARSAGTRSQVPYGCCRDPLVVGKGSGAAFAADVA